MTTSQARPQALRDYVRATTSARSAAHEARDGLVSAYAQLVAVLPPGVVAPDRPDVAGPLGRSRDVDAHCSTVAEWFERAGATGYGVATVDGVPAYTAQYGDQRSERLRERAERELARLRENIAAGNRDETTAGELTATLGWMECAIAGADDPYATAADLIDTMGPGDLHEALALLEAHARDIADLSEDSWPVRGVQDLMYVVSMGLERQPARAADWAEEVADLREIPVEPVDGALAPLASGGADGLALLGAYVPDGTSSLGAALFDVLFTAGPLPDDGLTARLHGTTSPVHPTLRRAAGNPGLANDIVTGLVETSDPFHPEFIERLMAGESPPTRFDTLFGRAPLSGPAGVFAERSADPMPVAARFTGIPQGLLGNVVTSSVHPALADPERIDAAASLTGHYVATADAAGYSDAVTRGLASATQPLLEQWAPVQRAEAGRLDLGGDSSDRADEVNADLWVAIGQYGESEGGVRGLATALTGATTDRLLAASEQGIAAHPELSAPTYPFHPDGLGDLNRLYSQVSTTVSATRFGDVVAALEESDVNWDTVHATAVKDVLVGVIGEFDGGSALGGLIDAGWGYAEALSDDGAQHVLDGTSNPFYTIEPAVNTQLIGMTLDARPDLREALYDKLQQVAQTRGFVGLSDFVTDPPAGNPELIELSNLVYEQRATIDIHDAQDHFAATNPPERPGEEG